ncbi:MAG: dolichol-phosphate mannosyltransferase [Parcubacteria group bacterium Gr01-1014_31]|nr:MAG: dolichol-phosphate mannosyltransferase [Parcubacteria group bacterium Gr01-1014_31]
MPTNFISVGGPRERDIAHSPSVHPLVCVVIPTYNERGNLEPLLRQIFGLGISNLRVLVVDDHSPDGTGRLADELAARQSELHVLHRAGKGGLGTAYVDGFRWALLQHVSVVVQMDADFSHDPAVIPVLISALQQGADVALGSRYVRGGSIVNWGFLRRSISRFGNWYARTVLGLRIRDLTGGFKAYRRQALEAITHGHLSSVGYNFQIETTARAVWHGYRVTEVPITFTERRHGKSKFNLAIMVEAFWKVWHLRSERPQSVEPGT